MAANDRSNVTFSSFSRVSPQLNYFRYISHFRSVHRGQFFTEMKTTAVRKLLPESWGFMCPVHTPDGSPCGLLNHLAIKCETVPGEIDEAQRTRKKDGGGGGAGAAACFAVEDLADLLVSLGVAPSGGSGDGGANKVLPFHYHPVTVDGKVIGGGTGSTLAKVAARIRVMKTDGRVPALLEVAYVPPLETTLFDAQGTDDTEGLGCHSMYPGLFLFSTPARFMRPVLQVDGAHLGGGVVAHGNRVEYIGSLEQVSLHIAVTKQDYAAETSTTTGRDFPDYVTHKEADPTNMLSLIASLTPFSDYNQSPRNMYQCQMGKVLFCCFCCFFCLFYVMLYVVAGERK
jgi:DNA-directed RNA polymerase I subunit RPA2